MVRASAVLVLLALAGCSSQSASEGAHVHGLARLTIAIDDPRSATVELVAPAESIYGFEHAPSSDEDRAAQAGALEALERRAGDLLAFDAALACALEPLEVEVHGDDQAGEATDDDHADEAADEDHAGEAVSGTHREVRAAYALSCAGDLTGTTARASFGATFPGIETLEVIVLGPSGQSSHRLDHGDGEVDL